MAVSLLPNSHSSLVSVSALMLGTGSWAGGIYTVDVLQYIVEGSFVWGMYLHAACTGQVLAEVGLKNDLTVCQWSLH